MRKLLVLAILVMAASSAYAKLEIKDIEASYGPAGPTRKGMEYYPYEEVFLRYLVMGIQVDEKGRTDCSLRLRVTGTQGEVLLDDTKAFKEGLMLGGNTMPGTARVTIPLNPKFPVGKYGISVVINDKLGNESATFTREFTLKPIEFALLSPRFSYQPKGEAPAPVGGALGQTLFFDFRVIGVDRSQGKIDAEMNVEILDADGKPTIPAPLTAKLVSDDPKAVVKAPFLTFNAHFALNRTGIYTLRITVVDNITKKKVVFETPLKVTQP